ncbi:MAG TPA: hypothetical protein VGZ73_21670 [Bryobacteraceae bacterium]|jgi:hypothetical protein|nr:hypothetical protein [Bryobacteraceae bacterium]
MSTFETPGNYFSGTALSRPSVRFDAIQRSVALGLKRAGLATVFVAADQKRCRVAALEGFAVRNPAQPASVVI